jgi:hypothetical protein
MTKMEEHEIMRSLGRLEGKVDQILDRAADDGDRITSLERKVWGFPAIGALAAMIVPKIFHQ